MIAFEAAGLQLVKYERQRGVAMTRCKGSKQVTEVGLLANEIPCEREAFGNQISGYWNGLVVPLFQLLPPILTVEVDAGDAPSNNPRQQFNTGGTFRW